MTESIAAGDLRAGDLYENRGTEYFVLEVLPHREPDMVRIIALNTDTQVRVQTDMHQLVRVTPGDPEIAAVIDNLRKIFLKRGLNKLVATGEA